MQRYLAVGHSVLRWTALRMIAAIAVAGALTAQASGDGHFPQLPRCRHAYERPEQGAARAQCKKAWTLLVYMAADNDLEPYAIRDLSEMMSQAASSHLNLDVLVHFEKKGNGGSRVERLRVFSGRTQLLEPEYSGRQVGAPAQELYDFLDSGIREYPSERIITVFWGHGQGWGSGPELGVSVSTLSRLESNALRGAQALGISVPRGQSFGGIGFSESRGTSLDIPGLAQVLKFVSKYALEGQKLDVYVADACLMQMVEVAFQMANFTDYIVGSSDVQEYHGLLYDRLLARLQTGASALEVATTLPRDFVPLTPRVSMSAVSSGELVRYLVPALDALGFAIRDYLRESDEHGPLRAMDLEAAAQASPRLPGGATEVGAWVSLIQILVNTEAQTLGGFTPAAQKLKRATTQVKAALHRTALAYAVGTAFVGSEGQYQLLGFKALSIWVPQSPQDYANRLESFLPSDLFDRGESGWAQGLSALFSE